MLVVPKLETGNGKMSTPWGAIPGKKARRITDHACLEKRRSEPELRNASQTLGFALAKGRESVLCLTVDTSRALDPVQMGVSGRGQP